MTFNNSTGLVEIETDNGSAFVSLNKPNFKIFSGNNSSVQSNLNEVIVSSQGTSTTEFFTNTAIFYDNTTGEYRVTGHDGNPLDSNNRGKFTINGVPSPGLQKTIEITQDHRFFDAVGSSQLVGNHFGTFTNKAWLLNMPFWLYAVANPDNNSVSFAISRLANHLKIPSLQYLSNSAQTPSTNDQTNLFFLDFWDGSAWQQPNLSDMVGRPCKIFSILNMVKNTEGGDWQISRAVSPKFNEDNQNFTRNSGLMPRGVNGAFSSQTLFDLSPGTGFNFSANSHGYNINGSTIWASYNFFGQTVAGGTSNIQRMALPLKPKSQFVNLGIGYTNYADRNFPWIKPYYDGDNLLARNFISTSFVQRDMQGNYYFDTSSIRWLQINMFYEYEKKE